MSFPRRRASAATRRAADCRHGDDALRAATRRRLGVASLRDDGMHGLRITRKCTSGSRPALAGRTGRGPPASAFSARGQSALFQSAPATRRSARRGLRGSNARWDDDRPAPYTVGATMPHAVVHLVDAALPALRRRAGPSCDEDQKDARASPRILSSAPVRSSPPRRVARGPPPLCEGQEDGPRWSFAPAGAARRRFVGAAGISSSPAAVRMMARGRRSGGPTAPSRRADGRPPPTPEPQKAAKHGIIHVRTSSPPRGDADEGEPSRASVPSRAAPASPPSPSARARRQPPRGRQRPARRDFPRGCRFAKAAGARGRRLEPTRGRRA